MQVNSRSLRGGQKGQDTKWAPIRAGHPEEGKKSFYDIWKESIGKGSAGSQLVGGGVGATRGRQALGFYRYLFLETNPTPQTGTQKELAIRTSLILAKFNREVTCRDWCDG